MASGPIETRLGPTNSEQNVAPPNHKIALTMWMMRNVIMYASTARSFQFPQQNDSKDARRSQYRHWDVSAAG